MLLHVPPHRLAFLGITTETLAVLKACRPLFQKALPDMLMALRPAYAAAPGLDRLLSDGSPAPLIASHWRALFTGRLDESYAASAHLLGEAHRRAGLSPAWYPVALQTAIDILLVHAASEPTATPQLRAALRRALLQCAMLDSDLVGAAWLGTAPAVARRPAEDPILSLPAWLRRDMPHLPVPPTPPTEVVRPSRWPGRWHARGPISELETALAS